VTASEIEFSLSLRLINHCTSCSTGCSVFRIYRFIIRHVFRRRLTPGISRYAVHVYGFVFIIERIRLTMRPEALRPQWNPIALGKSMPDASCYQGPSPFPLFPPPFSVGGARWSRRHCCAVDKLTERIWGNRESSKRGGDIFGENLEKRKTFKIYKAEGSPTPP